ncbi:MAG: GAF domain-containing protein, partial [Anaerolineae bacterium]|nr:GAF domain-containing protein [Anaerolineae bacterium]
MTFDCEDTMTNWEALDNLTPDQQIKGLRAVQSLQQKLGNLLNDPKPYHTMCRVLSEITDIPQIGLLVLDTENAQLETKGMYPAQDGSLTYSLNIFNPAPGSAAEHLLDGKTAHVTVSSGEKDERFALIALQLVDEKALLGAILAAVPPEKNELSEDTHLLFLALIPGLSTSLQQLHQYRQMRDQLEDIRREANIFRQIDDELSDIIEIEYVFRMIMDWALRFSNADAAGLSLYDAESDTLRLMAQYGYRDGAMTTGSEVQKLQRGITYRVARSGQAEIVPDVSHDKDYYSVADGIQTQMTVPIMREEQVIAVIALENRKLNGFTDEHLAFVQKLTNRAGVAVDNARLFTETRREREKLSHIVRNIADIVIVVGLDERIVLMNYSALLGFMLSVDGDYTGKFLFDVISHKQLHTSYREAIESGENVSVELDLPNKRTYHARISLHESVGRIIVMQDITHFKETDKLKTELIATVSHDLKQPLSVMR